MKLYHFEVHVADRLEGPFHVMDVLTTTRERAFAVAVERHWEACVGTVRKRGGPLIIDPKVQS